MSISLKFASLLTAALLLVAVLLPTMALAGSSQEELTCRGAGGTWTGTTCTFSADTPQISGENSILGTIANALLYIVGGAAVISIIINGFRMVVGGGDPQAVANARQGIIYGVVGVIVAFLAFAAVSFVADEISNPDSPPPPSSPAQVNG